MMILPLADHERDTLLRPHLSLSLTLRTNHKTSRMRVKGMTLPWMILSLAHSLALYSRHVYEQRRSCDTSTLYLTRLNGTLLISSCDIDTYMFAMLYNPKF